MESIERNNPQSRKEQGRHLIFLPENPQAVEQLENKLKEYKSRFEEIKKSRGYNDAFKAPEQIFDLIADTHYKIAVLETLLQEKSVNTNELYEKLHGEDHYFNQDSFINACAVINDYCETGGERSKGGTGFNRPV